MNSRREGGMTCKIVKQSTVLDGLIPLCDRREGGVTCKIVKHSSVLDGLIPRCDRTQEGGRHDM